MEQFYKTNELSNVICDTCTNSSGTKKNPILKQKKSVVKAPMQLRTYLQRSEYNVETDSFCKNKTKIALSAQYFLSCPNNPK